MRKLNNEPIDSGSLEAQELDTFGVDIDDNGDDCMDDLDDEFEPDC